jgi:hypothetical protein
MPAEGMIAAADAGTRRVSSRQLCCQATSVSHRGGRGCIPHGDELDRPLSRTMTTEWALASANTLLAVADDVIE